MKIFLDDIREAPEGWTRVHTYEEAIEGLKTGKVEQISLDNDLGTEKEGYDVAKWIEQQTFETNFRPPKIWVHSANPVAINNILRASEAIERMARYKQTYRGNSED
ncbi:hypothetical protein LCGC14_1887340 [marine sediment metagenome]|uniref:Cyclic-phosphate processing Receiver domain-containing protein n=1 Tax=marine sediment metagenome TaxID=412755 RepID=A0A0F9G0Q0_9ZZZZ